MKISTRCRYGLRSLTDLAANSRTGHVSLGQIAERQDISLKYLEQDFAVLRKAGLVRSVKGAGGGYVLVRDPARISVGEVVRILEGDLDLVGLQTEGEPDTAIRRFLGEAVWRPLNRLVQSRLDSLTLADLIRPNDAAEQKVRPMYNI